MRSDKWKALWADLRSEKAPWLIARVTATGDLTERWWYAIVDDRRDSVPVVKLGNRLLIEYNLDEETAYRRAEEALRVAEEELSHVE